ncbi:ricin-type beta-trefoil lectin domain protein [Streptomyces sp. NPDC047990]|uniref:ricin-type beta-trefoil lectin domain protein n=1 Tax=Streptomyces sp. NPDC047990 TaxID=3365496 RepID=UPI0037156A7C
MNDPALSQSAEPARLFGISDERLAAELKKGSGNTPAQYPVGELLDRHWEAVFGYARLCTNGVRPAGMLTTAAFTRLFGESLRQTGPTAAWRPQLLVTVRRMTAEWLGDQRRESLHPELLAGPDGEEGVAARLLPPENRRLLARAFQRLPEPARCLLWHVEIEAEQLAVPAGLLGIREDAAAVEVPRARERLREGCLEIHRELAPEDECRQYHRMLDVSFRRGGDALDPDLRRHMGRCRHCHYTAEQLNHFNGELALPLAESVLGWGAEAYLASRPGRGSAIVEVMGEGPGDLYGPGVQAAAPLPEGVPLPPSRPPRVAPRAQSSGGSRQATHKAPRRSPGRRNIALAALTASGLILVPLALWAAAQGSDGATEAAGPSGRPSSGPAKAPGAKPSWIGDAPNGTVRGRLRNVKTGLCVGIVGGKLVKGAETALTSCSSAGAQEWSYEPDGVLRDVADPGLCLDSHLGYSVQLASCAPESSPAGKNVRYDFTVRGEVVPRGSQDLALTPAATNGGGALVLKLRKDQAVQHWTLDTSSPSLQMASVDWDADGSAGGPATRQPSGSPRPSSPDAASKASPQPSAGPSSPAGDGAAANPASSCSPYDCPPVDGGYGTWGQGDGGSWGNGGHGYGDHGGHGGGRR